MDTIRTAIVPSIANSFPITPCSLSVLNQWNTQIMAAIKSKYKLWMCTSTALLREDKLHYGLGCSSLRIEYHYRNALALIISLYNKAKHGRLTKTLLEHQTQQLKNAAQGHLGPQCQTPKYLQKHLQYKYMLRARQYVSIHNSNLRLTLHGQPILTEKFRQYCKSTLGTQPACSGNPM